MPYQSGERADLFSPRKYEHFRTSAVYFTARTWLVALITVVSFL